LELDQTIASVGEAGGEEDALARTIADAGGDELALKTGALVGRYVVIDHLGSGAMGSVFAAYDPELGRRVALKILHERSADESSRLRMLREAQAMARLQHPNVVVVFDVGAYDGRIWLAMELVEGQTLGAWLRAAERDWAAVVEVLVAAAQGLAAAHSAGLIHRDVKPENIMISDGRVRVADFGLARAGADMAEETGIDTVTRTGVNSLLDSDLTGVGALVGTPRYMSPEGFLGEPVDARGDQYGWAVTAWEALYGAPPVEAETLDELRRKVITGQRRPPTGRRVPKWLRRIVERCLEVLPDARFPSMSAVVAAIEVQRRRRRWLFGAYGAAGVAALVAAGLAVAGLAERDADRRCVAAGAAIDEVWGSAQRRATEGAFTASGHPDARAIFRRSAPWLDDYAARWRDERTALCRATRAGEAEAPAAALACLEERRLALAALVDGVFASADRDVVLRSVSAAAGLPALAPCSDAAALARAPALPEADAARERIAALRGRHEQVKALVAAGKYPAASDALPGLVADAEASGWEPLIVDVGLTKAGLLIRTGDSEGAEALYEETLWRAASAGDDASVADAAAMLTYVVGYLRARPVEGLRWGRMARAALARAGDLEGMREATLVSSLGIVHEALGDYDAAQANKEAVLELRERLMGAAHPGVANAHNNLGILYLTRGEAERAEHHHRRAIAIRERVLGPRHPDVGDSYLNLGNVYALRKDNAAALAAYERALGIFAESYGEGTPRVAAILDNIAGVQRDLGDLDAALRNHREALAIRERVLPENHPEIGVSHFGVGACLVNRGDVEAGIAELRAGLAVFEASVGAEHPDTARAHAALGQALIDGGAADEGEIHLARAWKLCEAREVGPGTRGEVAWIYAQRLAERGEVERARSVAEVARGDFAALGSRDKVAEIDAWRAAAADGAAQAE
jgi:tetratricopeptide (TPR) repeat protein/tRNA A-37 threonylcarbamoyl transferase component Bud32